MAAELEDIFFEEFTLTYPQYQDFRLARATVINWLQKTGSKARWESRRKKCLGKNASAGENASA